jgi:hypothetical protein
MRDALLETLEPRRHLASASTPRAEASALSIATGSRHLIDATGQPLFITGDSAWSLIVRTTGPEVTQYLDARAAQGFNLIMVNLIDSAYGGPANRAGVEPFPRLATTAKWDFARPNEAYFAFADSVIRQADARGIHVLLCPSYLGYPGANDGFYDAIVAAGAGPLRAYGQFLGQRYASFDNVTWLIGGDSNPLAALPMLNALVDGIRSRDAHALITAHPAPETQPTLTDYNQPWLQLSNTYNYNPSHVASKQEYLASPTKPFFLLEDWYEGGGYGTAQLFRSFKWWSAIGGSTGTIMGNHMVWPFPNWVDWTQHLDTQLARDMQRLDQFVARRRWTDWTPDYTGTFLTAGGGNWDTQVLATRANDGKQALVYAPVQSTFTLDLRQMSGSVVASWFDPSTGAVVPIGAVSTTAARAFTTPGANGTGDFDWVLLLETDTVRPSVTNLSFDYQTRQAVRVQFSEDVYWNADAGAVTVRDLTRGIDVSRDQYTLTYDRPTRRWTATFSPLLRDGQYRLTIDGTRIFDGAALPLTSSPSVDFRVLAGDANRDGSVNFSDLLALAANYNLAGRTFSQGDFNYDGTVNFNDLLILASRYNTTLATASAPLGTPPLDDASETRRDQDDVLA